MHTTFISVFSVVEGEVQWGLHGCLIDKVVNTMDPQHASAELHRALISIFSLFHLAELILNKKFMPGSEEEDLNSILCTAVEGTPSKLANLIGTNWPDLDHKNTEQSCLLKFCIEFK